MHRLFNLIQEAQQQQLESIIVSLDAEKAFDRANWTFLLDTQHKFGFGRSFTHCIRILYSSPMPTITTNGLLSQAFSLYRGTRQGCPLSPSLFAFFIEPLAAAIHQNSSIKGLQILNIHHKISLYADYILLHLYRPPSSLSEAIKLTELFSKLSDDAINWTKSTILPINGDNWTATAQSPPIPITTSNIKYLGINISTRLSDLLLLNYTRY